MEILSQKKSEKNSNLGNFGYLAHEKNAINLFAFSYQIFRPMKKAEKKEEECGIGRWGPSKRNLTGRVRQGDELNL